VAHPCDESSLRGAVEAAELGLIRPILVGPERAHRGGGRPVPNRHLRLRVVDAPHSVASPRRAVRLAREGKAEMLMKGSLHSDEIMAAVVKRETGLRTSRRVSHCFVMDVPAIDRVVIITDAAVNIFPTLEDKVHIVQNAIDLAHALGMAQPQVAILSAMETINPKVPSTIEAAALCKMAERGQITGGVLDGPLALDNAIDLGAAKIKKITSPWPDRPTSSSFPIWKPATCWPRASASWPMPMRRGSCSGARADHPDQPADSVSTRLASCAVAALVAKARRETCSERWRDERRDRGSQRGSSSIKFSLFGGADLELVVRGQAEAIHTAPRFVAKDPAGATVSTRAWGEGSELGHDGALAAHRRVRARAARRSQLAGIGHRVVHGGLQYAQPVRVDAAVLKDLAQFVPLAPLHQPHNLTPIRLLLERRPELPQVACFDTAFHRAQPELAQMFALPRSCTTPACSATASTACRTSTSHRCCRSSTRRRRAGAAWSCTSATAPACARCPPAAASPARWASRRSTGCRWAPAAAPSTRVSSCT
jgi:phosphate acetyltransferase